jgi:hypothetical protein
MWSLRMRTARAARAISPPSRPDPIVPVLPPARGPWVWSSSVGSASRSGPAGRSVGRGPTDSTAGSVQPVRLLDVGRVLVVRVVVNRLRDQDRADMGIHLREWGTWRYDASPVRGAGRAERTSGRRRAGEGFAVRPGSRPVGTRPRGRTRRGATVPQEAAGGLARRRGAGVRTEPFRRSRTVARPRDGAGTSPRHRRTIWVAEPHPRLGPVAGPVSVRPARERKAEIAARTLQHLGKKTEKSSRAGWVGNRPGKGRRVGRVPARTQGYFVPRMDAIEGGRRYNRSPF